MTPAQRRRLLLRLFPSIMLPMYLAIGDQTTLATALPSIVASLGHAEDISLLIAAYLLANTIAAPVYGYVGDAFGRKRLMLAALGMYSIAGLICAAAPNAWFLIGARFLQGLGGGGLMSLSQALVGEAVPLRERGNFQGYMATVGMAATTIGPLVGGYVTQQFGWRYVFLFNAPLALIAAVMTLRLAAKPVASKPGWRFDTRGLVLFMLFIFPVMFGLQQAQRFSHETAPRIAALLLLAAGALFFLLRHEAKLEAPLLPVRLFRRRAIWQSNIMVICQTAILTSIITYLPIFLRVTRNATATEAGWLLVPMTIALSLGAILCGRFVSRTGRTMLFPSLALPPAALTLAYFALRTPDLSIGHMATALTLAAFLLGYVMGPIQVGLQSAVGPAFLGAAAASVQVCRSLGAAFGAALFATVLFATLAALDNDAGRLLTQMLNGAGDVFQEIGAERRAEIEANILTGFRCAFLISAFFASVSMVAAWTNPQRRI
jgi:EmrB/QacA subfamily drug resistance transporter